MAVLENKDLERWIDAEDPEPVLEPDLPIIDPHHHLWDLRKLNELGFRQEVYLCEEISIDIAQSGHNIEKTVLHSVEHFTEPMATNICDASERLNLQTALPP